MSKKERLEKLILKISLFAGIFFVILEFIMAIYSKSQAILMDAAFDGAELVVIAASLLLTPLLYKPISEKMPFGYAQCESLFIIIKGFMLVAVTLSLIGSNIQVLINGGNHVNTTLVMGFEFILALISCGVLLVLKHYGKSLNSPLILAEIYGWKVDALCGLGVAIAFLVPGLLKGTQLAFIAPYFDQIVAIILAISMIPEPIRLVIKSLRDLLLFAPSEEAVANAKQSIEPVCGKYRMAIVFFDLLQTGRKTWIGLTLKSDQEVWHTSELKAIHQEITAQLKSQFEEVTLEIIPEIHGD